MTDKELRQLSREDLLNLLLAQSKENERLRQKLNAAEEALEGRTIQIQQAGSIAEAALQLNGVFEAAQNACQQYIENVTRMSRNQESICLQREQEAQKEAARILADARRQAAAQEQRTKKLCEEMLETARLQAQRYWETRP